MHKTKKVIVFSYYWPPAGGPGVQRILKFAKYLKEFNWEPIIITVKNGAYPSTDYSLLKEIPSDIRIYKTRAFDPFTVFNLLRGKKGKQTSVALIGLNHNPSFFKKAALFIRANYFIPDARKGWKRFAYNQAAKILKKEAIDAIITTGPPHSTHLTGLKLKEKFNIPWLADFRDPWTEVYYNYFLPRTKRTQKKDIKLEHSVMKKADLITVISPGARKDINQFAHKTQVLYNGYDDADFKSSTPLKTKKFRLTYAGNFKPNQNVKALWQAIQNLSSDKEFSQYFELKLIGHTDPLILEEINNHNIGQFLIKESYLPHHEVIHEITQSSCLLFIIPFSKNNHSILTGKIFEYLGTQRPLLSIGPPKGDAASILKETERGSMIDYTHKESIQSELYNCFYQWLKSDKPLLVNNENHKKFTRKNQTQQLADYLNKITP